MKRSHAGLFSLAFSQLLSVAAVWSGITWATGAEITVEMRDDFFKPKNLTIQPGDTVRWVNRGNEPHSATSNTGLWDSGVLQKDQTFSLTFTDSGSFPYFCTVHGQAMSGTITVSTNGTQEFSGLFLVKLAGKCQTMNEAGAIVGVPQNVRTFLHECAEEHAINEKDLALVYDVETDAIEAVNRNDGSIACTVATFSDGVTLTSADGNRRERQVFVFWEGSETANGILVGTEQSKRGEGGELVKFSFRGLLSIGLPEHEDEPAKVCQFSFSTGKKFSTTH
jgi:plastocyanin